MNEPRYLIIGGAEKAGTTSLFSYFATHPQVCASSTKETDFFRGSGQLRDYEQFFPGAGPEQLRVESSPGYLALADTVAPRMAALVPAARLVFVLREPVDRLRSAFRFYKSRLHVPGEMSFDQFVTICLEYEAAKRTGDHQGLLAWHLQAVSRGRYERLLPCFETRFPRQQVLAVHYDRLRTDVAGLLGEIAAFAGVDPAFFSGRSFERENVSFLARRRGLQRLAIAVNDGLEGVWRRHPAAKRRLVHLYKRFNEKPLEPDALSADAARGLDEIYAPARALLARLPH